MDFERVYIVTGVPGEHLEAVLEAIAAAGGGVVGEYTHCAFTNMGSGRFKPSAQATPHLGMVEQVNAVDEWRVETFCARDKAKAVAAAIREAHPYEEPVVYMLPMLEEHML